jgi:hypothetical protein
VLLKAMLICGIALLMNRLSPPLFRNDDARQNALT